MMQYKIGYKDLSKTVRLSIDIRKMLFAGIAFFSAILVEAGFIKILALLSSETFLQVVAKFFASPLSVTFFEHPWQSVFFLTSLSLSFGVFSLFISMVSRIVYQEIVLYKYPHINSALTFLRRRWASLIFGPIGFSLFIIFLALIQGAVLQLGRISFLGHTFLSLLIVPLYFYNVFLIFLLIAGIFVFSTMYPVVLAVEETTADSAVISIINIVKRKPFALIFYKLLLLVWGVLSYAMVAAASLLALALAKYFMQYFLPQDKLQLFFANLPGLGTAATGGVMGHITWFFAGLSFVFLLIIVIGYLFNFLAVGDTILYLAIKEAILDEDRKEVDKLIYREREK